MHPQPRILLTLLLSPKMSGWQLPLDHIARPCTSSGFWSLTSHNISSYYYQRMGKAHLPCTARMARAEPMPIVVSSLTM